jgi:hypothetical protein
MTDKPLASAAYEAGYHDAIEELSRAITVDLAMCELATNEDASVEWLSAFWFAKKRVAEVIRDFTDSEDQDYDDL